MVLVLYLHIFVVLEGNKGIRKAQSIPLGQSLIDLSYRIPLVRGRGPSEVDWQTCVADFYGAMTQKDVTTSIEEYPLSRAQVWFFFRTKQRHVFLANS
jgi:hypothetical protein